MMQACLVVKRHACSSGSRLKPTEPTPSSNAASWPTACHHFPGFVYAAMRLIEATAIIEVDVRPRRG
jgi:hypothetical protein